MSTARTKLAYALNTGDVLGSYRIVRPLGAGGMGEVYLAEHVQLRKHYAIKVLPAELSADPQFLDRFRIEARVMADLEHTHIVRVHNFGDEQGRYYLVMDYVEGPDGNPRTLEDELAWGRHLPEAAVRDIALQICDALAYAHAFRGQGVIHRDLKPANILIAKSATTPDRLEIRVSDFGLAKILGTEYIRTVLERSTTLTGIHATAPPIEDQMTQRPSPQTSGTYSLLGTYDYMSPEQKVGLGVDARSDIFSVGIILYRMLTGHKPEGAFDPPSKKGVSRAWDRIVEKCLKREAKDRYGSIAALRTDVQRVGRSMAVKPVFRASVGVLLLLVASGILLLPKWLHQPTPNLPVAGTELIPSVVPAPPEPPSPGQQPPSPAPVIEQPAVAPLPAPEPGDEAKPVVVAQEPAETSPPPPAEPAAPSPAVVTPPLPPESAAPSSVAPSPPPPKVAEPEPELVRFELAVTPSDATVKVLPPWQDGRGEFVVPLKDGGGVLNLRPGRHTFTILRPNYQPVIRVVDISATNRQLTAALKPSMGRLMITGDADVEVSAQDEAGNARPLGTTDSAGRLGPLNLIAGTYELRFKRPHSLPAIRKVVLSENRPVDLNIKLDWKPGQLLVRSSTPADVWRRGTRLGPTGAALPDIPAGELTVQIRRPGFRSYTISTNMPPDRLLELEAPELVPESASVRINAESTIAGAPLPSRGRVRVNTQPWQEVDLPYTVPFQDLAVVQEIALEMNGYESPPPRRVRLADEQQAEVVFRMKPASVRVRFDSSVPASIFVKEPEELISLKRLNPFKRDAPVARTGEEFELESFTPYHIEFRAADHETVALDRTFTEPGKTYPAETISMEPIHEPSGTPSSAPLHVRPRQHH